MSMFIVTNEHVTEENSYKFLESVILVCSVAVSVTVCSVAVSV